MNIVGCEKKNKKKWRRKEKEKKKTKKKKKIDTESAEDKNKMIARLECAHQTLLYSRESGPDANRAGRKRHYRVRRSKVPVSEREREIERYVERER